MAATQGFAQATQISLGGWFSYWLLIVQRKLR